MDDSRGKIDSLDLEKHLPPEQREITVDIARNGDLLWRGGAHRLAIVKILGVDKIPVRICVRHKKWQENRDKLYVDHDLDINPNTFNEVKSHPDLIKTM